MYIMRLKTIIYNLLESIRISAVLLRAFIPDTADKIFKMLNTKKIDFDSLNKFGELEENINEKQVMKEMSELRLENMTPMDIMYQVNQWKKMLDKK